MPQIEHDPSPTPQRATLKFDPVFKWPWPAGRLLSGRRNTGVAVPLQFLRTFSKFWSPKATPAYRCWQYSFNTASHKTSGLSSLVFVSSIIFLAILSHRMLWSPGERAARAISNATAMTRLVSGSNSELSKNCAMGMTRAAIGNGIMQIPRVILVALHWGHNSGDASAMCRSAWARRSRGHLGLAHPGFLGKPFMLGPTNRAVNAREKDRGGVEA